MSDKEETFIFAELPKKVQEQIVDDTDPYDVYDEHWYEPEREYFKEWFNELLGERLGEITPANYDDIRFDQPRGQGPYYAYVDAEMNWGVNEIRRFIETSDTLKQNGIVNANLQLFEADKMAYGKSFVAPLMGVDVPSENSLSFGFTLNPTYLHSGEVSNHTSYDNFPFGIDDFEMRYSGQDIGQGVFKGYWGEGGEGHSEDDYDELSWPVIEEQVKPVYMWVKNTLQKVFFDWFLSLLDKMSDGMTRQSEYQHSKERVWDYWIHDYETHWSIDGEKL